MGNPVGAIAPL